MTWRLLGRESDSAGAPKSASVPPRRSTSLCALDRRAPRSSARESPTGFALWWAQIGNATPVPETEVALFGIRDLSLDTERERVERSRMLRVAWVDGLPDGDTEATVATLAGRVEQVYLHIDLDALDPLIAPGIVDAPVPRGLSLGQLDEVLDAVTDRLALGPSR